MPCIIGLHFDSLRIAADTLRFTYDCARRPLGGQPDPDQQGESGLLYRRNRYCDPATGRFTQQDPIGLAGGMTLYGFAAGDPVNFSDPFGLMACDPPDDPECEDRPASGELQSPLFDPVAILTGGIAAGVERSAARLIGREVAAAAVEGAATVRLFRSVSQAELDDIATGAFRAGANSLGGKWFATMAEHAARWGELLGNPRIVQVEMPADAVKVMMRVDRLDNIGPAVYGELDQLLNGVITVIR